MLKTPLPPYASASERLWYYTLRTLCGLILLFLLLPVLVIIPLSFSDSTMLIYPIQSFSTHWYTTLFHSDEWMRATRNSFIVAPAATLIATVLGTLAAAGLHRAQFPGKGLLMAVLISPMIVPLVVTGLGIYLFFAPYGLVNSYPGLILALAAIGAPFVVTTVSATLQGFDPNLLRASYSLGVGPIETFFKITLPIIAPGVIAGALFAFATAFDEIVITLFLAGPEQVTLPRQMFTGIRENISPVIAAVATILILFSTSLLLVLEWLRGRAAAKTTRVDAE
ncbi:ABC transporter permease [Castellaniella caeni]|uniref:ABC transporter permease n=1 Tax=Castellaniella caeni TaxID=266123 RepID=UPI00082DEA40|nr:ABC transporter permease [Castellaniella caeni]